MCVVQPNRVLKNGRKVITSDKVQVTDQVLLVQSVGAHDAGVYECTDGRSTEMINVEVIQNLSITIKVPGKLVKPEMELTMTCLAKGYLTPEVVFYKNNDEKRPDPYPEVGIIKIDQMSLQDEGEHTCQAVNAVGSVSKSVSINMKIPWIEPSWQEVFSGQRAELTCLSRESVEWRGPITDGSGLEAPIITGTDRFHLRDNRLIIEKAYRADSGRYQCSTGSAPITPFST